MASLGRVRCADSWRRRQDLRRSCAVQPQRGRFWPLAGAAVWMFDRAECAAMGTATIPRVNLAALSALAMLLMEGRGEGTAAGR